MSYSFEENLNCSIFMLTNTNTRLGLERLEHNTYIKSLTNFTFLNGPAYFTQKDINFDNNLQCYTLPNGYNYFIEVNLVQGLDFNQPGKFDPLNGNLPYVYNQNSTTTFSQTSFILEDNLGQQISNVASSTFLYENSSAINSAIAFLKSPSDPSELVKFKIKHLGNSCTILDYDNSANPVRHPDINNGSLKSRILIKAFPANSPSIIPDYSSWINKNNINRNISWILYNNKTLTTSKEFEIYYQNEIKTCLEQQNTSTSDYFYKYPVYYSANSTATTWNINISYLNTYRRLKDLLYFNDNSKNFIDPNYTTTIKIAYPKSSFFLKESNLFLDAFNPYPCYLEINFKKNKIRWGMFHSNSSINSTYTANSTPPIIPTGVKKFPQLEKLVQKTIDIQTINGVENILYKQDQGPYNQCYIIDLMAIKFGWVFKHPLTINIVLPDSPDDSSYKDLNNNSPIFNDLSSIIKPSKGDKISFVFKYFDKKLLLGESISKQQSLYSDYGPQQYFIHDTTTFDNYEFTNHMSGPLINKKICLFISNTSIHDSYPSIGIEGKALLLSTSSDNIPSYFYSGNLLMEYLNERSSINLEWNGITWKNQKEIVFPNNISSIEKIVLPNFRKNKLKLISNIQPDLSYSTYTNLPNGYIFAPAIINKLGKYTYVKIDNLVDFSYKNRMEDSDDMIGSDVVYQINPSDQWVADDIIVFKYIRESLNSKDYISTNSFKYGYYPNITKTKNRISIKDNTGLILTNSMPISVDSFRKDYIFKYNGSAWEVLQKEDLILNFKQSQLISYVLDNSSSQQLTLPNQYSVENIIRYTFNANNNIEYYLPVINSNLIQGIQLIFEIDKINNPTGSFIIKDESGGKIYSELTLSTSNRKTYIYQYDGIDWVDIGEDYIIINELPTSTHDLYKNYNIVPYPSFTNPTPLPATPLTSPLQISSTTSINYMYHFNNISTNNTYTLPLLNSTNKICCYFEFVGGTGSFTIKDFNGNNLFDTVNVNSAVKKYAIEWNGSKWCILNELKYLQNY